MLTIRGIEDLRGTHLGYWKVMEAGEESPKSWLKSFHYCITIDRRGDGAAILIDREINPLTKQYHVYVCYTDFDNRIYEGAFSRQVIMDKGHFLKHMMGYVKAEYDLRKQKQ